MKKKKKTAKKEKKINENDGVAVPTDKMKGIRCYGNEKGLTFSVLDRTEK